MTENVFFHPEADKELTRLDREKQRTIRKVVEKFKKQGTGCKEFAILETEEAEDFYRLKVKKNDPVQVNQRLLMSVYQDRWIIYGVKHREDAYEEESLKQMKRRKY